MSTPSKTTTDPVEAAAVVSVVFSGAIFGFFFAWVCSTMWGLDSADPRVAIEAMQAMNASVRNPVFAPAFFGTPFVLFGVGLLAAVKQHGAAAKLFVAAGLVYLFGGLLLTVSINVPLNQELADIAVPDSVEAAEIIWKDYSRSWKRWNLVRTVFSGISLVLASLGLASLARSRPVTRAAGVSSSALPVCR